MGGRFGTRESDVSTRLSLAALLLLTVAGCAHSRKELDHNPPFSEHQYRYFDVEVDWRAKQRGADFLISGTVRNLRSYFLQDLELTARLSDARGNTFARGTASDFPNYIPPDTTEPFRLEISTPPGASPAQVHFSYVYWLIEAAPKLRGHEDVPHFGSFVSPP
jgi:hypothetical protein